MLLFSFCCFRRLSGSLRSQAPLPLPLLLLLLSWCQQPPLLSLSRLHSLLRQALPWLYPSQLPFPMLQPFHLLRFLHRLPLPRALSKFVRSHLLRECSRRSHYGLGTPPRIGST